MNVCAAAQLEDGVVVAEHYCAVVDWINDPTAAALSQKQRKVDYDAYEPRDDKD